MDKDIVEWLEEYLEKRGAVAEVGPDYYQSFLELSDKELRRLLRMIIYGNAQEINRMIFDEQQRYNDNDILKLIQNTLSLIFRGLIRFDENGNLCVFARQGPEPKPKVRKLLDEKVSGSIPLIRRAMVEVMNRQTPLGRKS